MTTAVAPAPAPEKVEPAAPIEPRLYRLSVAQFEQMIEKGVLTKHDKVELIEGFLVKKMTKNSPHIAATLLIPESLRRVIPPAWFLAQEVPVLLARSEPEPDFLMLRGPIQDYFSRKPVPADVALLIEVADSSLAEDRSRATLFAEANIPTYWIANIPDRRIEVYSNPAGAEYRSRTDYGMDAEIPLVLDGHEVARLPVRDLVPPPEKA
jgi:hypothetical protein